MAQPVTHQLAQRRRARGFAMIAMVTMVALISSYLLASVLTRTSTEVRLDNDQRTQQALKEAKTALIAYAASQAWTGNSATDQPGSLPCPAANELGTSAGSCSTASTRIGRLPWKTIGASELRDGSGNILWYALSANFRNAPGSTVINSDTAGTLTITGSSPASNLVAVIIAPGSPVSGQIRNSSSSVDTYLEGSNASNSDSFVTASISSDTFNDQIIPVTQGDLMAVVEPAVAARIERDIKPYLTTYATQWSGAYPFPATFPQGSASQSSYSGSTSTSYGLLPITDAASYSWSTGTGSVALLGGKAASVSSVSCSNVAATGARRCSFTINPLNLGSNPANWGQCTDSGGITYRYCIDSPVLRMQVSLSTNAGRSISETPTAAEVTSNRTPITSTSLTGTLSTTGAGTLTYQATYGYIRYSSSSFTRTIRFDIPLVTASNASSSTDPDAGWFIAQQWYRQTYYAVSTGYLPGGSGSCTAGTTCLTVNELPSSRYPTKNDKRAILVFMGRALNNTSRPSSTLTDYLEGENTTPADNIFVHRAGATISSNDRVVVLAP
jgi:hypothetical protein